MIAGSFIAAYGHMLNDWLYRSVKNVEAGVNNRLSTVGGGGNTPAAVAGAEAAAGNAAKVNSITSHYITLHYITIYPLIHPFLIHLIRIKTGCCG